MRISIHSTEAKSEKNIFFATQLWFPAPDQDFQRFVVLKIRSETCQTKAQFCQNSYMIKKESLQDRPKFCRSGSAVWHLFWRLDLRVNFRCFCEVMTYDTKKKHYGRNIINDGCLCRMEFTRMSLYSTEITPYRSWFLGYKLTQVNSVPPHGRPWWIVYILFWMSEKKKLKNNILLWLLFPRHAECSGGTMDSYPGLIETWGVTGRPPCGITIPAVSHRRTGRLFVNMLNTLRSIVLRKHKNWIYNFCHLSTLRWHW